MSIKPKLGGCEFQLDKSFWPVHPSFKIPSG